MRRRHLVLIFATVLASMGAQYRTTNFVVIAADAQVAQQVGQYAEHYRKEKAIQWLGQEMPTWPQPCPLHVQVTMDGPQGATSFQFGQGRVLGMKMEISGPLNRLLASVLPHEITHTVFAHYFRCPVPRWADEGGSVLSEDDVERDRHDKLTRNILNSNQQFQVRRLFDLREYPREMSKVMCLYAQGYSLSDYLVKRSDRRNFLAFVAMGMQPTGWDHAAQSFYGHRTVEELEEAWLKHLRDTRRQNNDQFAQNTTNPAPAPRPKTLVRTTVPPAQPLDPVPVVRGSAPSADQSGKRFGDYPQQGLVTAPIYVPTAPNTGGWQPAQVQLGVPQFPQVQYVQPQYAYPR